MQSATLAMDENEDTHGVTLPQFFRPQKGLTLINHFNNVPLVRSWSLKDQPLGLRLLLSIKPVLTSRPVDVEAAEFECAVVECKSPLDELLESLDSANVKDDDDNPYGDSTRPPQSFLSPPQQFVPVEPPRYGARLAPMGPSLDLSSLQPHYKVFPLANEDKAMNVHVHVHDEQSLDELKLLAIWNYELYGEDDTELDDQLKPTRGVVWKRLIHRGDYSLEAQHRKNNPWYRLTHSLTSDDHIQAQRHGKPQTSNVDDNTSTSNMTMFPKSFHMVNKDDATNKQVVGYVQKV